MRDAPRFPSYKTKKYHFLPQGNLKAIKHIDNIVLKPIEELIPYSNNSRTHSPSQIEILKKSIIEYGFINPVLITKKGEIIAGHGRVRAAQGIMTEIPCVIISHLTEAQRRAFIIADNKMAELAGWDDELLRLELGELKQAGFDLSFTGFSSDEIENLLLEDTILEDNFDIDKALEQSDQPLTQAGDLWLLGKHRLLCGDATKQDDITKLMDGKTANLLVTDPPYNVDYTGTAGKIQNDNMSDSKFHQFLTAAISNAVSVIRDGASYYIWHADSEGFNFRLACHDAGLTIRQCLIWVKSSLVLGRQDYQWRHEPCLYGWKDGSSHYFTFDRSQSTVIDYSKIDPAKMSKQDLVDFAKQVISQQQADIPSSVIYEDKPLKSSDHPTMKPIKLLARLIANSSRQNDIILDTFLGSGSTLIATDQLNRVCYGLELDPKYCDVIAKRYAASVETPDIKLIRNGKEVKIQKGFFD